MYSQEFWDDLYLNHFQDAPWMDDSWKTEVFSILEADVEKYAKKSKKPLRLLDYGCGNGRMGYAFFQKGMKVDLCDISQVLIDRLKESYKDDKGLGIIRAGSPAEMGAKNKYDVIIAWNLFHHINPKYWRRFVAQFLDIMKKQGILFISGWDKEDVVVKEDHNRARFTHQITWFINDLPQLIEGLPFTILEDRQLAEEVPVFHTERKFRYYVIKKTEQQSKHNNNE